MEADKKIAVIAPVFQRLEKPSFRRGYEFVARVIPPKPKF
jgi:hypothetical protein